MSTTPMRTAKPPRGVKYDTGKRRYDLLPWEQIDEVVDVLTFGAAKYADDNWKIVPDKTKRYKAALGRHISAYMQGEQLDKEDGKSHLAHAVCCAIFLMWGDKHG